MTSPRTRRTIRCGARLATSLLLFALGGCDYVNALFNRTAAPAPVTLLVCHGDFGQFANGFMVARPMELDFVVNWQAPAWVMPTNGGSTGRIINLSPTEFSFDVQYEGYRAAYHLNRVDGTFSQRPNLGGVFFGSCETKPYTTKL